MLGHGQVEGYREQYGMEFRRARLQEAVDEGLLAHHEWTIFPLLQRRAEFAGSDGFRLYDFETGPDQVNEDVFAYSNRGPNGERSLVLFHNRYAEVRGRARRSSVFAERGADGDKHLVQASIGEGLGLVAGPGRWLALRNAMTGLEELRSATGIVEDGFAADLAAYSCRVYVDLRDLRDAADAPWSRLAERLGGAAVPSLTDALADLVLEPEHDRMRGNLLTAVASARTGPAQIAAAAGALRGIDVDGLRLGGVIRAVLARAGLPDAELDRGVGLAIALSTADQLLVGLGDAAIRGWFADPRIRTGLRVNTWDQVDYVEREAWLLWLGVIAQAIPRASPTRLKKLSQAAAASGYRVDRLVDAVTTRRPRPGPPRRAPD
jgi:hypothetical protein